MKELLKHRKLSCVLISEILNFIEIIYDAICSGQIPYQHHRGALGRSVQLKDSTSFPVFRESNPNLWCKSN